MFKLIFLLIAINILVDGSILKTNLKVPKLIVISFDGFKPSYISIERTPTLYDLSKSGVWGQNMKPTFSSKTAPNHFSIATGYYQETHGIVNNKMFDPLFNETFTLKCKDPKWWDNGLSKPIWIANQLGGENRFSGTMMWAGSDILIHGQKAKYIHTYDGSPIWYEAIDEMVSWMTRSESPANLVAAYFNQPDKTAHRYGSNSNEVYLKLTEIDNLIKHLIVKLVKHNLFDITNLIILSDHGMADVTHEREIDLSELIDLKTFKMFGSSPVWNILPNKGLEDEVYRNLKKLSDRLPFTVYKKDEIPEEYHYRNNRRILDILIVADGGYDIFDVTWKKPSPVWGNHGYNNSIPEMKPTFIGFGPRFKTNYTHETEFMNIDLYPLMLKLLDLDVKHFPSNGTIEYVNDMLKENID